jgi:DNA-binding transcriptional regulator YdaS (Cro superfamily)
MISAEIVKHLQKKIGKSDVNLASFLGVQPSVVSQWRNRKTELTPLQVAGALVKVFNAGQKQVHLRAIKPIVEFFPIELQEVGESGKSLEVFPTGKNCGKYYSGLHGALIAAKSGLYVFYDTRGCALYAGQTKKQNIWKEMNSAFNRDRSAQVVTLVRHPLNDVAFKSAHLQVRQPKDRVLKLHDLAAYFSAYEVVPEMVDDLEALLVRAFPNDLLNFKMEKFGKSVRKVAADKKLAKSTSAKRKKRI